MQTDLTFLEQSTIAKEHKIALMDERVSKDGYYIVPTGINLDEAKKVSVKYEIYTMEKWVSAEAGVEEFKSFF